MAIMAEVEERILRTDNFEDIITILKSDPAQWSDDKLRGLLTAAYLSSVSEEELKLASETVTAADASSLSRRGPQVYQAAAAVEASAENEVGEGTQAGAHGLDANPVQRPERLASAPQLDEFADIMKHELEQLQWAGPSAGRASVPSPLVDALDAKSLLRLPGDAGVSKQAEDPSKINSEHRADGITATGDEMAPVQQAAAGSADTQQSPSEAAPFQPSDGAK
jgi:hypothetical protein